ncbi:MAG: metallophosphoesterase family protein [Clostridia bacterium]
MKKFLTATAVFLLVFVSILGLVACDNPDNNQPYTYEPSGDYYNLYVTLTTSGSSARAFTFFTPEEESYRNACVIQLDPADIAETEPQFNTDDNIVFNTQSEIVSEDLLRNAFPLGFRHKGEATGLKAGQKYFYRVGSTSKDTWGEWGSFVTDDGDDSFSFMHITDAQSQNKEEFDALEYTLKSAYDYVGVPEFIVSSGDQIENFFAREEWNMLHSSTKEALSVTSLVPVHGNHELVPYATKYNFNVPEQETENIYYSFDYGNALVVVLDTQDMVSYKSPFDEKPQFIWLEEVLKNSTQKWKIVTLHKSLYSTGSHSDDIDVLNLKAGLVPLFGKYGVDLVLSGHDHCYARTMPVNGDGEAGGQEDYSEETLTNGVVKQTYTNANGTVHVINRAVGSKFYGNSRNLNDHLLEVWDKGKIEKPVFSMVEVEGDTLTYTSYEHDRDTNEIVIIDCFALYKPEV